MGSDAYGIAFARRDSRGWPAVFVLDEAKALREEVEVMVPDSETGMLRLRPSEDAKALIEEDMVAVRSP